MECPGATSVSPATGLAPVAAQVPRPAPALMSFVVAALLATFTAGSLLGAINLFRLQFRLEGVSFDLLRLHAAFQLNGLMALFVCGVALQALPRFWGTALPPTWLVRALPVLLVGSLVARVAALPGGPVPRLLPASAGLASLAGLLFMVWLVRCRASSARPFTGLDALLLGGAVWWPAGNLAWLAGELPPGEPFRTMGVAAGQELLVFGFLLSWLLGMGPRVLPFFARLGHPRSREAWLLFAVFTAGVAVRGAGLLVLESARVAEVGRLLVSAGLAGFVLSVDRPGPHNLPIAGTTGSFRRAVVAALAWAGIGALILAASAVQFLARGRMLSSLELDAARHVIAVGFATGLLVAVSSRLVPTFLGRQLPHPRALDAGLLCLHAGVLLRLAQGLAAHGLPWALGVSGLSGFLVVAGLLPWAINMLALAAATRRGGAAAQGCAAAC